MGSFSGSKNVQVSFHRTVGSSGKIQTFGFVFETKLSNSNQGHKNKLKKKIKNGNPFVKKVTFFGCGEDVTRGFMGDSNEPHSQWDPTAKGLE